MPPRSASFFALARLFLACLFLASCALTGCASLPPGQRPDARDPWERMNRATYQFNNGFDKAVAKPAAKAYVAVTPHVVQTGVSNFFDNLGYPITIVNDLLQAKFKQSAADTGRLLVNTTIGIGGLFDPASKMGLDKNDEDFGQTLGRWGVKPGPYVVIPFLGFSDTRDSVGRVGDYFTTPTHYIDNNWISYPLWGLQFVDTRARLLQAGDILNQTFDPYTFAKNAYLQRRQYLVTDGEDSGETPPPDDDETDSTTAPQPAK